MSPKPLVICLALILAVAPGWLYWRATRAGGGPAAATAPPCMDCLPLPQLEVRVPDVTKEVAAIKTGSVPGCNLPSKSPWRGGGPLAMLTPPHIPELMPLIPPPSPPAPAMPEVPKFPLPYQEHTDPAAWAKMTGAERLTNVRQRVKSLLGDELRNTGRGLKIGAPMYLRAFKETRELEVWMKAAQTWELFRTYPIAAASGALGPKLREGDGQTPEGFYSVRPAALNPASSFHLSFNIGYPNDYDRHHQRTGSAIMVHGSCVSIGCLAMTDPVIEELYLLVEAALRGSQRELPVHVFPFRMTEERMRRAEEEEAPGLDFWRDLREGYTWFETRRTPPKVRVADGRYEIVGAGTNAAGR